MVVQGARPRPKGDVAEAKHVVSCLVRKTKVFAGAEEEEKFQHQRLSLRGGGWCVFVGREGDDVCEQRAKVWLERGGRQFWPTLGRGTSVGNPEHRGDSAEGRWPPSRRTSGPPRERCLPLCETAQVNGRVQWCRCGCDVQRFAARGWGRPAIGRSPRRCCGRKRTKGAMICWRRWHVVEKRMCRTFREECANQGRAGLGWQRQHFPRG